MAACTNKLVAEVADGAGSAAELLAVSERFSTRNRALDEDGMTALLTTCGSSADARFGVGVGSSCAVCEVLSDAPLHLLGEAALDEFVKLGVPRAFGGGLLELAIGHGAELRRHLRAVEEARTALACSVAVKRARVDGELIARRESKYVEGRSRAAAAGASRGAARGGGATNEGGPASFSDGDESDDASDDAGADGVAPGVSVDLAASFKYDKAVMEYFRRVLGW